MLLNKIFSWFSNASKNDSIVSGKSLLGKGGGTLKQNYDAVSIVCTIVESWDLGADLHYKSSGYFRVPLVFGIVLKQNCRWTEKKTKTGRSCWPLNATSINRLTMSTKKCTKSVLPTDRFQNQIYFFRLQSHLRLAARMDGWVEHRSKKKDANRAILTSIVAFGFQGQHLRQ